MAQDCQGARGIATASIRVLVQAEVGAAVALAR
jgi:hypothetical protein